MKSYLGVTLHFPMEQELNSVNIGVHELSESHTADYIGRTLVEVLNEFGVPNEKVVVFVTDNGANMVKAIVDTFGKNRHIPCFAHTLNLICENSLENAEGVNPLAPNLF